MSHLATSLKRSRSFHKESPGRWKTSRPFTLLILVVLFALATYAKAATIVVTVTALIDGRDQLILQNNTMQWHHFDYAAVGRHEGRNEPTTISLTVDGVAKMSLLEWIPMWSAPPPNELNGLNIYSSVFNQLLPGTPQEASTTSLSILEGSQSVSFIQRPLAINNYTSIIEFNDNAPLGSQFYTVQVVYRTVPEPSVAAIILVATCGLWQLFSGRRSAHSNRHIRT